jgi:YVTN family beta-propeller protein
VYAIHGLFDNLVSVIDGATNKLIDNKKFPTHLSQIAINNNTNVLYMLGDKKNLLVIDGSNFHINANIPLGISAEEMAINPRTNMVYVTDFESDKVYVIDGTAYKIIKNITVADGPTDVDINAIPMLFT